MRRILAVIIGVGMLATLLPFGVAQDEAPPEQTPEEIRAEILEREGSYIDFYGHLFSTGRGSPMPMNTQYPLGEGDYSRGIFGPCGPVPAVEAPPPVGTVAPVPECDAWSQNEEFFYTTAGFVQIKDADEWTSCGCYANLHNERGQTKDIYIDTNQPVETRLFMSADWHAWLVLFGEVGNAWNWDPGYFLDWVVEARLWHGPLAGEFQGSASEAPNVEPIAAADPAFTLIAEGRDGPKPLGGLGEGVPVPEAGRAPVTEFLSQLAYTDEFLAAGGIIPKEHDIVLEFEWFQETNGQQYITATVGAGVAWNMNSGEDYPPGMRIPVRNPMDVELVFPRFVHEKIVVLSVINTPWGSYDISDAGAELEIRDATGKVIPILPEYLQDFTESSVAHSGHFNPIRASWVWDYKAQSLPPGEYEAVVKATNFQESYTTETAAAFTIAESGLGESASSGRSGIGTFEDQTLSNFEDDADTQLGGNEATETEGDGTAEVSNDSPTVPALLAFGALAVAAVVGRRRQA